MTLSELLNFDPSTIDSELPEKNLNPDHVKLLGEDYVMMMIYTLKLALSKIYDIEGHCYYYIGQITAERRDRGEKKLSCTELDKLKGLAEMLHHKAKSIEQWISALYSIISSTHERRSRSPLDTES